MGKGRKRIAEEIQEARGYYDKHPERRNPLAVRADGQIPEPPESLNADEIRKWRELVEIFQKTGILGSDLQELLLMYCSSYGMWIRCRRQLELEGHTIQTPQGTKRNPVLQDIHKCKDVMIKLLPEFGLTPSSRSKVSQPIEEDEEDPFQNMLDGDDV